MCLFIDGDITEYSSSLYFIGLVLLWFYLLDSQNLSVSVISSASMVTQTTCMSHRDRCVRSLLS